MPRFVLPGCSVLLLVWVLGLSYAYGETASPLQIRPVCGNRENGIAVGKPRLYDERTLALLIDGIERRLKEVASGNHPVPGPAAESLAEETQLTFQIENLKSLYDRALSDRVLPPAPGNGQALRRGKALLGFQISVDPKQKYTHASAEVEVTVMPKNQTQPAPALTALLPLEKTYNIASLSRDPQASSLAPVVLLQTGPKQEPVYLLKDSDTVSLERFSPTREVIRACSTGFRDSPRDLTFAWQFRPVLNRESVEPGMRHVYALLALPTSISEDFEADIHVHTHWRSLKREKKGKLSAKAAGDFFEESSRDELWTDAIRYNQAEMELSIRPRITGLRFVYSGSEDLRVVADGENFLADTEVKAGNTALPLTIERESSFQFMAPARLLMQQDAYVTGRFGVPLLLLDPDAVDRGDDTWGLKIEAARARPKDYAQSEVRIKLKSRQRKRPPQDFLVNKTMVVAGAHLFPVTNVETDPTDSDALLLKFEAPTATLRASPRVVIARLFAGEAYRDSADLTLEDDISADKVTVLSSNDEEVMLGISGSGFTSLAVVQISGVTYTHWTPQPLVVNGSSMITLKLKRHAIDDARQLTVAQGFAQPIVLPMPELKSEPKAASQSPARKPRRAQK